jgi:hypothetical protein
MFPSKLLIPNETLLKELSSLAVFTPSAKKEDDLNKLEQTNRGDDESGEKQTAVEAISSVDTSSSSSVGDRSDLKSSFGGIRPSEHLDPPHPSSTFTMLTCCDRVYLASYVASP